ncbi:ribosome biogenesis protein BRX1 homolog [Orussus abietinus]|uniref:ribosome biogenesis protein BRX1 homolog n=1 Tax=Orussus abietinus TaxID=222816 RepID=UPI000625B729|nr:ribosome biogenesis protein BRX1 homolog [Orussus abietinus]
MVKKAVKRKRKEAEKEDEAKTGEYYIPPSKRMSDEPIPRKDKWVNKQRVLVLGSRGISHRDRHLMNDIKTLMPHHRPENKMERSKTLQVLNEICEMKNCNKALLFEGRRKRDLYLWLSHVPTGPSAKFLVQSIYTMGELKLTGNCLKGSRPLLSFDENFSTKPHYALLKEMLTQTFGVPNHHPKSQPFFDHVYSFTVLDNRIWFRNFQILTEDGGLTEIGPRFVLNPVKIFAESFGGETLWENPHYVSPAKFRQSFKKKAGSKYLNRIEQKVARKSNKPEQSYALNPMDEIFKGEISETAEEIQKVESENRNSSKPKKMKIKKQLGKKKKPILKKRVKS